MSTSEDRGPAWTLLTNHARVLLLVAEHPRIRVRDMSQRIGITERAVHRIVSELEDAGYLSHETIGRRNHYTVADSLPLRHHMLKEHEFGGFLKLLSSAN